MAAFFQFQESNNFLFPNANTNRAKSIEFALVGVVYHVIRFRAQAVFS